MFTEIFNGHTRTHQLHSRRCGHSGGWSLRWRHSADIELTCCWHDVTIIKPGRKPCTRRLRVLAERGPRNFRGCFWF